MKYRTRQDGVEQDQMKYSTRQDGVGRVGQAGDQSWTRWSIVDQDEGEQDQIKFRVQEKMEKM